VRLGVSHCKKKYFLKKIEGKIVYLLSPYLVFEKLS